MPSSRLLTLAALALCVLGASVWLLMRGSASAPVELEVARDIAPSGDAFSELANPRIAEASTAQAHGLPSSTGRIAAQEHEWTLRVFGDVYSEEDETRAIPDAEIDVIVHDSSGERSRWYPSARSDESGTYSFEIAIDEAWRDPDDEDSFSVYVELHVWAPEHSFEVYGEDVDLTESGELEIPIGLVPGADVTGFVFLPGGQPACADVVLVIADGDEEPWTYQESTDVTGFYRIHADEGGVASVRARDTSAGTARVDGVEIDASVRTRIPDLHLAGSGTLGGVLVDPNGEPIAGHRVSVIAEELIEDVGESPDRWKFSSGASRRNLDAESADGMMFERDSTSSDGTFHFVGLRPGRYLVRATHASNGAEIETERQLHATGRSDIRLVLGIHRLVVTVRDAGNVHGVHCSEWSKTKPPAFGSPPPPSLSPVPVSNRFPMTFEVRPGGTYLVGLHGELPYADFGYFSIEAKESWDVASSEKIVHIDPRRYVTHVELGGTQGRGTLKIDIDDPQSYAYEVMVTAADSGRVLRAGTVFGNALPFPIELAPGRYSVRVSRSALTLGSPIFPGFDALESAQNGLEKLDFQVDSLWQEAEVVAGGESTLRFRFEAGGRLRVTLPTGASTSPVTGFITGFYPSGGFHQWDTARNEVEIENATGDRVRGLAFEAQSLFFEEPTGEPSRTWFVLASPLAEGAYVLRWKPSDGKTRETHFEITAGELTSLELTD